MQLSKRANQVRGMWLKEETGDNSWVASQITSYNARLGDYVVGGSRAPRLDDMEKWRAEILAVRAGN